MTSATTSTSPGDLGRELVVCPRRRPGLVFGVASLVLGIAATVLLVGLLAEGKTRAGDLAFVGVLVAIFLGLGAVLLALRRRTIARREIIHIHEHGIVREDCRSRREWRFADIARLQARIVNSGYGRMYAIALRPRSGRPTKILSLWFDNVDDALIALLQDRTGLPVEPL
jgi:hypothetical protein